MAWEYSFDASTQNNDFCGTVSADGFRSAFNVESDLKKLGVPIADDESLVGLKLSFPEIGRPRESYAPIKPYVYAFFEQNGARPEGDPVPLRKVRILGFETVEHFVRILKRLDVSLSLFGGLTGRTYIQTNQDDECYEISPDSLDTLHG